MAKTDSVSGGLSYNIDLWRNYAGAKMLLSFKLRCQGKIFSALNFPLSALRQSCIGKFPTSMTSVPCSCCPAPQRRKQ